MAKRDSDTDDVLKVVTDLATMFSERFDQVDKRFDQLEMELFKQGNEIKTDLKDVKQKVNHIYNVLDAHMKRIEDIMQDNVARDHQQERMERWIFQLADKLEVKLKYE